MKFSKKVLFKHLLFSTLMVSTVFMVTILIINANIRHNTHETNAASGVTDITNSVSAGWLQNYSAFSCWSATCNQLQGFTVANDRLVYYIQPSGVDQGAIRAFTGSSFANTVSGTPKDVNYGHGNDMTYNSATDKILVIGPNSYNDIYILNRSTLEKESSKAVSGTWGIGYDEFHNYYVLLQGKIRLVDSNFQKKAEFSYSLDDNVSQGIEYHNGYVYHTTDNWDNNLGGEIAYIYVYNAKLKSDGTTENGFGDRVATYYINAVNLGEIESISFSDDKAYFGFANSTTGTTKFYSIADSKVEIPLETTVKYTDNQHSTTVKITGDAQLSSKSGFTLSSDEYSLSKSVNSGSISESIKVCDHYNNCKTLNLSHTNSSYIEQRPQTVSFANSSVTKRYGDAAFTNKATTTGDGTITYSSSNTSIATVNNDGKVTIKTAGKVTITATAAETDNYSQASSSYILTIEKAPQIVSFANSTVTKTYGDAEFTNKATTTGDGTINYSSSNTSVATVDSNGKVTIKSAGHTVITAVASTTTNYLSASDSYNLTVEKSSQNVSFADTSVTKTYGDVAFTNKATTTGDGEITYTSTDNAIATVDNNGKVTINAAGTVTIIATAEGTNNCTQATADYSLTINKAAQVVSFEEAAKTITIDYGVTDFVNKATANNSVATISYTSSDDKVATVEENGEIVTKKSGKVIITATASNENFEEASNSYELNIQYVLSFDINGGTGAVEQQACISEENFTDCEIVIPSDIPSKEDLFFLGWSEDPSGSQATYYTNEKISITNNKKLYAIWTNGQVTWIQNNEHDLGDDEDLTVEINVPLEQFDHVEVDGETISEEKYQLKSGSTVLTLKASFLDTLSEGKHSLAIFYDNDSAVMTTFEIKKKPEAPNTGKETKDTDRATVLLSVFMPVSFSFVGVIIFLINRRISHRKIKF